MIKPSRYGKHHMAARPAKAIDDSTYVGRFAIRLKALREKAGKTVDQVVAELAEANMPTSRRTYYDWESAHTTPPMNALPVLAELLGSSP